MISHKSLFCLIVLLGAGLLLLGGCNRKPKDSPDSPVLEALAAYNPTPVLNESGRVVELKLEGSQVNDQALDQVKNLPELKSLSLYGSSVTDDGLAKLVESNQLQSLGLGKTAVSRRGLSHLERLPALRWVWVSKAKDKNGKGLTPEQVEDFKKKAVPRLTVYFQ